MKIMVSSGKYVVAVSGGVDSMALLHALTRLPDIELVVAHFDHGIRPDSSQDCHLVRRIAKEYGLPYTYDEGALGADASEEVARRARYAFLRRVCAEQAADAVITAHHKDDVLETAVINIIRGTGRKGLSSLGDAPGLIRPLLGTSKSEIRRYADEHGLVWREDSTNADHRYLRNHIRHNVLPRLSQEQTNRLYTYILRARTLNADIDVHLDAILKSQKTHGQLDRTGFILLPHKVSLEVMAAWLRVQGIRTFDKKMLERCVRGAKIQRAGTRISLDRSAFLRIGKESLALDGPER
jgi:tRNA(Ile)-lysidine synthetase-like protein